MYYRLSEANLQPISSQLEDLYRKHSRADTSEQLVDVLKSSYLCPSLIPERLLMEQAMLVAVLHGNVGVEVGE